MEHNRRFSKYSEYLAKQKPDITAMPLTDFQYEIIMSKPLGIVIDLKCIGNIIKGLGDEFDKHTIKYLIDMATNQEEK